MTAQGRTQGERIVALEASNKALAIEVRDLKFEQHRFADEVAGLRQAFNDYQIQIAPLLAANVQLAQLIADADKARGMGALAKFLVGGGVVGTVASAIAGVFYFFARG